MRGFRFQSSLKKRPALKAKGFFSQLRRLRLRPLAEHVSACGRRNEAPRRTREKTCGTQRNASLAWNKYYSQTSQNPK